MKLTIFGGSGGTGAMLIDKALDAGHTVTAPARNPARIARSHERLRAVRADVLDRQSLDSTMDGADAVLSALGSPAGKVPTTVYSTGVANILAVMHRADVRRLIGISALPVTPRAEVGFLERRVVYPILDRFFGEGYADMERMEQLLQGSDLDWTVMRPPMLTNGPATGRYRTAINRHLPRGRTISRADLAAAMIDLLDEPQAIHATVGIAY